MRFKFRSEGLAPRSFGPRTARDHQWAHTR